MSFLILVRHGQSIWNLENKFTGWVDVDLTEQGKNEAKKAGSLIKDKHIEINYFYSSLQLRAIHTLKIIQKVLNNEINFTRAWQLNERHYGNLTSLNKVEMSKKLGEERVYEFRRSWDKRPEPLSKESPYHPINIKVYEKIPKEIIPDTESLKDTYERVLQYFNKEIKKKLIQKNVLISAHGNSLRALCKYLFNISNTKINELEIPTGNPLVIEFENDLKVNKYYYLDKTRTKNIIFNQ